MVSCLNYGVDEPAYRVEWDASSIPIADEGMANRLTPSGPMQASIPAAYT
jgi:hypothetical protein